MRVRYAKIVSFLLTLQGLFYLLDQQTFLVTMEGEIDLQTAFQKYEKSHTEIHLLFEEFVSLLTPQQIHQLKEFDIQCQSQSILPKDIKHLIAIIQKQAEDKNKIVNFVLTNKRQQNPLEAQLLKIIMVLCLMMDGRSIVFDFRIQDAKIKLSDLIPQDICSSIDLQGIQNDPQSTDIDDSIDSDRSSLKIVNLLAQIIDITTCQTIIYALNSLQSQLHTEYSIVLFYALTLNHPQMIKYRMKLADLFYRSKMIHQALREWFLMIKNQQNGQAFYKIGLSFRHLNSNTLGMYYMSKALKADPQRKFKCLVQMGEMSQQLYKIYQALYYFQKCYQQYSNSLEAVLHYVNALYLCKEYSHAQKILTQFQECFSIANNDDKPGDNASYYLLKGKVLRELKKPLSSVLACFQRARSSFEIYLSRFENILEEQNQFHPTILKVKLQKGITHIEYKQINEGLELLQQVKQYQKDEINATIYLAKYYFKHNQLANFTNCLLTIRNHYFDEEYTQEKGEQFCCKEKQFVFKKINFQLMFFFTLVMNSGVLTFISKDHSHHMPGLPSGLKKQAQQQIQQWASKYSSAFQTSFQQFFQSLKTFFGQVSGYLIKSANQLYDYKQYRYARKTLMKALELGLLDQAQKNQTYYRIAITYEEEDKIKKAVEFIDKIDLSRITNISPLKRVLKAYKRTGQNLLKIQQCCKILISLNPEIGEYYFKLAELSFKKQIYKECTDYLLDSMKRMHLNQNILFRIQQIVKKYNNCQKQYLFHHLQTIMEHDTQMLKILMACKEYNRVKKLISHLKTKDFTKDLDYIRLVLKFLANNNAQKQEFDSIFGQFFSDNADSYEEECEILQNLAILKYRYGQYNSAGLYYEKLGQKFQGKKNSTKMIQCFKKANNQAKVLHYTQNQITNLQLQLQSVFSSSSSSFLDSQNQSLISQPIYSQGGVDMKGTKMKRLYELYVSVNIVDDRLLTLLENLTKLVTVSTPFYYQRIIQINLQHQNQQSVKNNIKKLIKLQPTNHFAAKTLLTFEDSSTVFDQYYDQQLTDKYFERVIVFMFLKQFNKCFHEFQKVISEILEINTKDKKGQMKRKDKIIRILKIINTNQVHIENKTFISILRLIIQKQNKRQKIVNNEFIKLKEQLQSDNEDTIFDSFFKKISELNIQNQCLIFYYVYPYFDKETKEKVQFYLMELQNQDGLGKREKQIIRTLLESP